MKRIILLLLLVLLFWDTNAQSRIELANFTQFQQNYNPSLTGYNGSVLKTLYRNQWTGFEDAPKTIFASAELDLSRLTKRDGFRVDNREQREYESFINAKHALGLSVLHDKFGPTSQTELNFSYGAGIKLSDQVNLRWGTALTFSSNRLDGNSLTVDQENDPKYKDVLGRNNGISKIDLNIGLALTSSKFYLGYSVQDITEGKFIISGDDFLKDMYVRRHIIQGGYRTGVSEQLGVVVNSIYQFDELHEDLLEGQVKVVYNNTLWIGTGYRNDLAYNIGAGFRLNQLSIAYAYETPVQEAQAIRKATNEISISYNLFSSKKQRQDKQVMIW